MPQSALVRWFCRFYLVMLYAYPREFRLQFGGEMQQLFRDRCRLLTRTSGRLRWVRFAFQSAADWLTTMCRERAAEITVRVGGQMQQLFCDRCRLLARTPGRLRWVRFAFQSAADWLTTICRERVAEITVKDCGRELWRLASSVWSAGRRKQPRGFVWEWAMTLLVFLFATTTLVQAYVVPTGSMEGTLRVGDHMLVDRMAYADPGAWGSHLLPYRDVQRGDIVALHYPEDVRQTYVKRVIGIPGDRIRLENKQVVRNGVRLMEPYAQHIDPLLDGYRDNFPAAPSYGTTPRGRDMLQNHVRDGEVIVPPGMLFLLGDNRDNSADSRYWGFAPRDYVVGKPLLIYWSYDAPTADLESWSLSHVLDVVQHFFTKTRWERTFRVPRSQQAGVAQ
jgi:signal peptidase I